MANTELPNISIQITTTSNYGFDYGMLGDDFDWSDIIGIPPVDHHWPVASTAAPLIPHTSGDQSIGNGPPIGRGGADKSTGGSGHDETGIEKHTGGHGGRGHGEDNGERLGIPIGRPGRDDTGRGDGKFGGISKPKGGRDEHAGKDQGNETGLELRESSKKAGRDHQGKPKENRDGQAGRGPKEMVAALGASKHDARYGYEISVGRGIPHEAPGKDPGRNGREL